MEVTETEVLDQQAQAPQAEVLAPRGHLQVQAPAFELTSSDVRNLGLLLVGFACVVLLVPLFDFYPVYDDWAYAQSVSCLRWLLVVLIALSAIAAEHDYLARVGTRWEGAEGLVALGVSPHNIYAGFE